jgi:PPP family 3-phenylpropionic acid transporter
MTGSLPQSQDNSPSLLSPFLGAYYFFYFALVGVYVIFMPKVLLSFNYSTLEVGIIYAAAPFMRFLLPFIFRHYIVLTPKVYLIALLFTFTGTLILLGSIEYFWFYLSANLLFGAAMGVSLPYVETIALATLSKSHYGKVRLWGSLGFMGIALWLGKVLASPHEALYYLSSMAFLTLVFGAILTKYDTTSHMSTQDDASFSLSKYWAFWISIFLMQVSFGGFYNFFTIYETEHGISLEMTSYLWSFGVICEIIMLYFQGPLLKNNLLNIIKICVGITVFRWILLYSYPDSLSMTFISQSLHAFSFGLYHSTVIIFLYTLYDNKKLAQQFMYGVAYGLGGFIGALVAGWAYGEYLYVYSAIFALISLITLFLI